MSGKKPNLEKADPALPTKSYTLRFLGLNKDVVVKPEELPYGDHGLAGSILDTALSHSIDIDHACGGVAACSTCHIYVKQGLDTCPEPSDAELDQLDNAPAVSFYSRLACQCVPNGSSDITIEIPSLKRNRAREGK